MATNGNDIIVYRDGTAIAATRSADLPAECNMIEVSSPNSAQWREYIPGRKGWTLTVTWLVVAETDVRALLNVGTSYTLKFKGRSATDAQGVTGTAILKTCRITATRGNVVQGSFAFQGSGALT